MASTTSGGTKRSGSTRSRASKGQGSSSRRASSSAKRPQASSAKRPQASRRRSGGRSSSGNGASANPVEAVRGTLASGAQSVASGAQHTGQAIASGAQQTGQAIGGAASKAKAPALAGGAALAGMVGGMAIAARGGRRKVLGIPVPGTRRPLVQIKAPRRKGLAKDVVKAAGTVGKAGGQAAELATEVRLAREKLDSGQRRSPLEVVLEGLTARRGRAG